MHFSKPLILLAGLESLAQAAIFSAEADKDPSVWGRPSTSSPVVVASEDKTHRRVVRGRFRSRQTGWNPRADLAGPLKEVWDHTLETYNNGQVFSFKNYGWDQLEANNGALNYCVRWESDTLVSQAKRDEIATVVNQQYQKWFNYLYGYDGFPYTNISVNVVGWAVKDKSLLEGSTDGLDIYTDVDSEGIPQCAESCGRFFNQGGDYSGCAGGAARHYDQSLWLTDGMGGGAGGDWGQRFGTEYFLQTLGDEDIEILLHEMGHTFGLDDFYDWKPTGIKSFVMLAGAARGVTEFDGWMLRNWWYELSRERGW
ncbi:cellulose-binding family II [Diaporthe helianthi]|uniref:Cellulose-binding family II n=1 Tax=Diaporthe helianthi TaxID=158607 RepID=A0A2P5I3Q2_DIAHE|nr:cellulose-binding family II [Diaporthe helianthi]